MNPFAILLFISCAILIFKLPRRWVIVPLLIGICYVTKGQGIMLGGLNLQIFRMLLIAGFIRTFVRGERLPWGLNPIDKLVLAWSVWILFASFFHEKVDGSGPEYALGEILNIAVTYFIFRRLIRNLDDIRAIAKCLPIILVPVATAMAYERVTGFNLFSVFGGVSEIASIRNGDYRASGPFRSYILAGTVGSTCFPLSVFLFKTHTTRALLGCGACVIMVLASDSSGPLMSLFFAIGALLLWFKPGLPRLARLAAIPAYIMLDIVMYNRPYYLMDKIDLSGGSTGRHRAELIDKAITYFNEWWLFGTDYTRHWMRFGVSYSDKHADITNYYIAHGINGGFLLVIFIFLMLYISFAGIGKAYDALTIDQTNDRALIWCMGASLFAHAATSISVSYFDQSVVFFWMTLAICSFIWSYGRQVRDLPAYDKTANQS